MVAAFLKGDADHAVHRDRCPDCRDRWNEIQVLGGLLSLAEARGSPAAEPCPDPAAWAALADRTVDEGQRRSLLVHLVGCDACSRLWAFLSALGEADDPEDLSREAPQLERGSKRSAPFRWLAAAAMVGGLLIYLAFPPAPVQTGGAERWRGPVSRLHAQSVWPDIGSGPILGWQEWTGASAYSLRVWDGEGSLVFSRFIEPAVNEWPLDLGNAPAGEYYWSVEAFRESRIVARSPLQSFVWSGTQAGGSTERR